MRPLLVVGAGLFGSMAARLAVAAGREVVLIDDAKPQAASKCAAGLFRPSWLGALGDDAQRGIDVLRRTVGVQELDFDGGDGKPERLSFVSPRAILGHIPGVRIVEGRAMALVRTGGVLVWPPGDFSGFTLEGDVYVAAGFWTRELVAGCPPIRGGAGAAFVYEGARRPPAIRTWAPYRQAIAFEREPGSVFFSDGTSILPGRYREEHDAATSLRAFRLYSLHGASSRLFGWRPFVEGGPVFGAAPGYERTWFATGGGKIGTVAAALFAERLLQELAR